MDDIDFIQPKKIVGKLISIDELDKIRAEIAELGHYYPMGRDYQKAIIRCIAVIDKYKSESERQESGARNDKRRGV